MEALKDEISIAGFSTAEARWARFGPYYAMFPVDFAYEVVKKHSDEGDYIIDPFAGRGSSVYVGGVLGRHSLGIEINPVGWLYGAVKLRPADKTSVLRRLKEVNSKRGYYTRSILNMPKFFRMCYCDEVLKFLLSARRGLDWRNNIVDATLMSILLVYLHGKIGEGLSNQMRMTKAMGPMYSINWWKKNGLHTPPEIDPVELISKKINWRYGKGTPRVFDSKMLYGDSTLKLDDIVAGAARTDIKFSLLFTSPPYCDVTNYYADQWLRLWLLGGAELPKATRKKNKGRFTSREKYAALLDDVFGKCASLMKENNTVFVRTDKREFTFNTTLDVLQKHFPNHSMKVTDEPFKERTQTDLHGNSSKAGGEIDIVLKSV